MFVCVGITALAMVAQVKPEVAQQYQMIVIDCLDDPDETLKKKVSVCVCVCVCVHMCVCSPMYVGHTLIINPVIQSNLHRYTQAYPEGMFALLAIFPFFSLSAPPPDHTSVRRLTYSSK